MSLYGALFTGVSGLSTQGQKIGIISDNIANVNTVGYKEAEAKFSTLVVNTSTVTAYSPGGAKVNTHYNIDQQGILSSTNAPTDIAISGNGFFVVTANADGDGQALYTRAGSFRQDQNGNFVNAQGFFLRGWPLDREGRLPGEPGNLNTTSSSNLESLETVNVESLSGTAEATSTISLGINLDADEIVYPGETVTANMDSNAVNNFEISGSDIIVPDETSLVIPPASFGLSTTNNIARGDAFTITTGNGLTYDYFYGGFTMGRDINTAGSTNIGDGGTDLSPLALAAGTITGPAALGTTFTVDTSGTGAHGLATGDRVVISGFAFAGAETIPLTEINTTHVITVTGASTFTFSSTTPAALGTPAADNGGALTTYTPRLFSGNILDAVSASQSLVDPTTLTQFTTNALSFTITTPTAGTVRFTYTSSSPSSAAGQFNTLTSLATAIDEAAGLTARVVNGRLVVGAEDATELVTFANVDATGTATLRGIDWVTELDLANVASGSRRFSNLNGLANLINDDEGVTAVVNDPLGESTLDIRVDDPLDTIRLQDYVGPFQTFAGGELTSVAGGPGAVVVQVNINGHGLSVGDNIVFQNMTPFDAFTSAELNTTHTITNVIDANNFEITINAGAAIAGGANNVDGEYANTNTGSILAELGLTDEAGSQLVPSLLGGAYTRGDTGALGPKYDSSAVVGENIASGDIEAQFTRSVRIYDALGIGHDINYGFIKIDENEWAVEVYAVPADDVNSALVDGQIAVGTITFNGDGSLRNVSGGLSGEITVNWTNGAQPSAITLDLGTAGQPFGTPNATLIGDTDGLRQFGGGYDFTFFEQDGSPVGELVSVTIDEDGYVIASYTNGENQQLYKLPIADFINPNGLQPLSGNVYAETVDSGDLILREAGENGVGDVVSGALEQSNVDLAEQLTDMIVAQRAYQSNTRVISTTDELLEQLNNL